MEETNYLSNFKTEKEMREALKTIRKVANDYYRGNPLKFKKMGYEVDDLELIIHEHLLIKFHNTGFMVSSITNLNYMCKMSMNTVLRNIDLKFGRDLTQEEKEDNHLNIIRKEVIKVDSLSELMGKYDDDDSSNPENKYMVDGTNLEEVCSSNIRIENFCNMLKNKNPDYVTIFKVDTYLNDGINLINNDVIETRIFELFSDLLVDDVNNDISNIDRNDINIEKINDLSEIRNKIITDSVNKYNVDNLSNFEKEFLLSKHSDIEKYRDRLETNLLLTEEKYNKRLKQNPNLEPLDVINKNINKIIDEKVKNYIKVEKEKFIKSKTNLYKKEQENKFKDLISINRKRIKIDDIINRLGINITKKGYEDTYKTMCKLIQSDNL